MMRLVSRRRMPVGRGAIGGFASVIVWLVVAGLAAAEEPQALPKARPNVEADAPVEPSEIASSQISSNQSVSLDDLVPSVVMPVKEAPPVMAAAMGDVKVTGESPALTDKPDRSRSSLNEQPIPRSKPSPRRRSSRRGLSTLSKTEAMPWYRSGLGALGIVLAVLGMVYYAARRWWPAARSVDSRLLKVVGRASLSPRHNLALIQLGRRFVMVGVSSDRLTTLCEIADPEEVTEIMLRTGSDKPIRAEFNAWLAGAKDDFDTASASLDESVSPEPTGDVPQAPGALTDLLNKLRTLQTK